MDMRTEAEINAFEQELVVATGPFMPINVAMTRLCEAAVRGALDKTDLTALVACAAARKVCERALRDRGTSSSETQRLTDRAVGMIAARLML